MTSFILLPKQIILYGRSISAFLFEILKSSLKNDEGMCNQMFVLVDWRELVVQNTRMELRLELEPELDRFDFRS